MEVREGLTGNDWEDRKIGRRKDFLVRRMELAKHFIRTNIEPEWMVLCLLPVLPHELRPFAEERWPVFNPWLLLDIWDLIRWLWKGILLP
ncbi:hypothetical protein ERO13_D07G155233v2 [Gossypium hirsutum]|nr:hypothetical protein ERO13_D07G155233v2 [Gossypium hirsutum]